MATDLTAVVTTLSPHPTREAIGYLNRRTKNYPDYIRDRAINRATEIAARQKSDFVLIHDVADALEEIQDEL